MRLLSLVVIAGLLVACGRPIEVRGLYVIDDGTGAGALVPCDQPKTLLTVADSGLATRYRLQATTPYELLFVRLRGVRADSGSIYGGRHYLQVRQILAVRARGAGECPNVASSVSSVLH
jgi:hypothetical protein